jgi:hypothetical protein
MVGNDLVLDCYRLARYFHVSPTVFLEMGLTEVDVHMARTGELARIMEQERAASDDG